jgi:hypothetical protein
MIVAADYVLFGLGLAWALIVFGCIAWIVGGFTVEWWKGRKA